MMVSAGVWRMSDKVGTISTDGETITIDPPEHPLLAKIAAEPLRVPVAVDPKKEPEKFVRNLHLQYRNPYLNADAAKVE